MCLLKIVGAVLLIAVLAGLAFFFLRGPEGVWVVDRDAMAEAGKDDLVSRVVGGMIPDITLTLAAENRFTLALDGSEILRGNWKYEGGKALFTGGEGGSSVLEEALYEAPGRLVVTYFERSIILKRN
jgi:hypothetical protein